MVRVVMQTNEYTDYGRLRAGDQIDVPMAVALRWRDVGVALPLSLLVAPAPEVKRVTVATPSRKAGPSQGWTRGYNWAWLAPAMEALHA